MIQLVNTVMYMTNTYGFIQALINGLILLFVLSVDLLTTRFARSARLSPQS